MNKRSSHERIGLSYALDNDAHTELLVIMYTSKVLSAASAEVLRSHALTEAQFNALVLLANHCQGPTSQIELSRRMLVNRANITGLVDRMVRDGLVKRNAKSGDRRVNLVSLTPAGRARLVAADADYQKVVQRITAGVSPLSARKSISKLLSICDACEKTIPSKAK